VSVWLTEAIPVLANRWWRPKETDHAVNLLGPRHVFAHTALPVTHQPARWPTLLNRRMT
jgi:long-chain acyl-CoA synthetase